MTGHDELEPHERSLPLGVRRWLQLVRPVLRRVQRLGVGTTSGTLNEIARGLGAAVSIVAVGGRQKFYSLDGYGRASVREFVAAFEAAVLLHASGRDVTAPDFNYQETPPELG